MRLTSLLMCADAEAVQVLNRVFDGLDVDLECCGDVAMAKARIEARPFAIVLIDCLAVGGIDLLHHIRNSSINNSAVVIALLNAEGEAGKAFAAGANFVLYSPVSRERATHCLRAARSLVRQERRLRPRITFTSAASMAFAGKDEAAAELTNINEFGLGVRTSEKLPPFCKVYFQFSLPGDGSIVRLAGEVMWQDASGRVGIRFANVPPSSRKVLRAWVEQTLSVEEKARSLRTAVSANGTMEVKADLGPLRSNHEKRDIERRECKLGADVYRPENSAPVRCILTDMSSGGCYVETTDPFPEGTAVEIMVRTESLKLCIVGRVRSVNRGFGMGVQFSLRDADQQRQVTELVEWVGKSWELKK